MPGVPFTLPQGEAPTLDDLTLGGKTSGEQEGRTVRWAWSQVVRMDHSLSPITPQGAAAAASLADLFGITPAAAAGGISQTTATLLSTFETLFISVNANAGARLPSGGVGRRRKVWNISANDLLIWPEVDEQIEDFGVNAPVLLAVGACTEFVCSATGLWRMQ